MSDTLNKSLSDLLMVLEVNFGSIGTRSLRGYFAFDSIARASQPLFNTLELDKSGSH